MARIAGRQNNQEVATKTKLPADCERAYLDGGGRRSGNGGGVVGSGVGGMVGDGAQVVVLGGGAVVVAPCGDVDEAPTVAGGHEEEDADGGHGGAQHEGHHGANAAAAANRVPLHLPAPQHLSIWRLSLGLSSVNCGSGAQSSLETNRLI